MPKLRETFGIDTTLKTLFEIHSLVYMGDEGGITCDIRTPGMDTKKAKAVFLCSITHFRIKEVNHITKNWSNIESKESEN